MKVFCILLALSCVLAYVSCDSSEQGQQLNYYSEGDNGVPIAGDESVLHERVKRQYGHGGRGFGGYGGGHRGGFGGGYGGGYGGHRGGFGGGGYGRRGGYGGYGK